MFVYIIPQPSGGPEEERGRIKKGEKELRSENVEKTLKGTLLRGRRGERQTEQGEGERAVLSHHYCL